MIQKPFAMLSVLWFLGNCGVQAADFSLMELGTGTPVDINNSGVVALNDGNHGYRVVDGQRTEVLYPVIVDPTPIYWSTRVKRIGDGGHALVEALSPFDSVEYLGVLNSRNELLFNSSITEVIAMTGLNSSPAFCSLTRSGGRITACSVVSLGAQPGYTVEAFEKYLYDLNDAGVATGYAAESPNPDRSAPFFRPRAIRVNAGVVEYLDPRSPGETPGYFDNPSQRLSEGMAINEAGHVVGRFSPVADGPKHAFRYVGNGLEDLGTLGGVASEALDITDNGWIVGQSQRVDGEWRPFLWRDGVMVDLNTLLPAGLEVELLTVSAINNAGSMVGSARFGTVTNAYLLSPSTLVQPPRIGTQPQSQTVAVGGSVTFSVTATGGLPHSYQWLRNGVALPGETNSTLSFTNVTAFSQGGYRVQVANGGGSLSSDEAVLTVLDPKLATIQLVGVTLEGEVGAKYLIEYTPAINPTTWQALETVVLTNSPMTYVDMASSTNALRIYRATRVQP